MKKTIYVGIVAIAIIGLLLLSGCTQPVQPSEPSCEKKYGWICRTTCLEGEEATDGGNLGCGTGYACCVPIT